MLMRRLWGWKPILAGAGLALLAGCRLGGPNEMPSPYPATLQAPHGPGVPVGPGAPLVPSEVMGSPMGPMGPHGVMPAGYVPPYGAPGPQAYPPGSMPTPQRPPAWSFGNRSAASSGGCAHGEGCPSCAAARGRGVNPLSRPLEAFGVSSQEFAVAPVSYDDPTTVSEVPCPPGAPCDPPTWQVPTWYDATGGSFTPADEFIFDGGDDGVKVLIDRDWTVRGLDQEDTVAHYDTVRGLRLVEESNRVPIYAPRFGSVRKVYGIAANEAQLAIGGLQIETAPIGIAEVDLADTTLQQLQPRGQVGQTSSTTFRDRTRGMELENEVASSAFDNRFATFEDLAIIRYGTFDQNEGARLSEGIDAATSWGNVDAAEATISNLQVDLIGTGLPAAETVGVEEDESRPRLRLVKVASRSDALPGDIVEFAIRFDNVGNETLGNVTILDHLSPRLEVIEGSPQCTLDAEFFSTIQDETTEIFRAEITDPLPAGQGGIVRFKCLVR